MKLYRFNWGWDYHKQAAFFVMASNEVKAAKKAQDWLDDFLISRNEEFEGSRYARKFTPEDATLMVNNIGISWGCDD
jgi:hypothetical protein